MRHLLKPLMGTKVAMGCTYLPMAIVMFVYRKLREICLCCSCDLICFQQDSYKNFFLDKKKLWRLKIGPILLPFVPNEEQVYSTFFIMGVSENISHCGRGG